MFYIFIVFFAIATIVLYQLQKNHKQESPLEGQSREKTVSLDVEQQQQTEIFTARHPGTTADATETLQKDASAGPDLTPENSPVTEHRKTTPTSQKITFKGVLAFIAAMTYCITTFTLMEMAHPLGIVFLGILILASVAWFIWMPPKQRAEMKAEWAKLKVRARAAEEQKARSPFRKAMKVIGASIALVILLIILIEFFGKFF